MICFEALDRLQRGLDAGRLDRFQYSLGDRLVDLHSPHIQAQGSPLLGQLLALAVIPGRGGLAGVVGRQSAAALSTSADPLKQGCSLAHRTFTRAMGQRPGVARQTLENGLVGGPVDIGRMMIVDQHPPFGARQLAGTCTDGPALVDMALTPRLAVGVGAGIDRIGQYLVDGVIGWRLPAKLGAVVEAMGKIELLHQEPAPHPARRSELGESIEHGADRDLDLLIGVEQDLRFALAAHVPDGLPAVKLATGCLVSDAAVETRTQDMKLRFAHRAFQPICRTARYVG